MTFDLSCDSEPKYTDLANAQCSFVPFFAAIFCFVSLKQIDPSIERPRALKLDDLGIAEVNDDSVLSIVTATYRTTICFSLGRRHGYSDSLDAVLEKIETMLDEPIDRLPIVSGFHKGLAAGELRIEEDLLRAERYLLAHESRH